MKRFFTNWWVARPASSRCCVLALLVASALPIFVGFMRPWWVRLLVRAGRRRGLGAASPSCACARRARRRTRSPTELAAPDAGRRGEPRRSAQRMARGAGRAEDRRRATSATISTAAPWYVIIGPPGAGKTTALLNSGLRFPFAEQRAQGRRRHPQPRLLVRRRGGAGRHRRPLHHARTSDAPVDRAGLDQLPRAAQEAPAAAADQRRDRRDRRRRADPRRLRQRSTRHAAAVRRRLAELRATLEVAVPVYVLLTKADLLAGFVEFYDDLDVEGRRAVLGATLPLGRGKPTRRAAGRRVRRRWRRRSPTARPSGCSRRADAAPARADPRLPGAARSRCARG